VLWRSTHLKKLTSLNVAALLQTQAVALAARLLL